MCKQKKSGFTLAEVLIVLGIIGVVAALTIPTLMKHYQRHVTVVRLKQTYSMFAQALKLSEIDHDSISQWNVPNVEDPRNASNRTISENFADEYFVKYFKGVKKIDVPAGQSYVGAAWYRFPNGVMVSIWPRGTWGEIGLRIANNSKTTLKGINSFVLVFAKRGNTTMYRSNTGGVAFYGYGYSINQLKNDSTYGCYPATAPYSGLFCGALIQANGWKIPDDYPY